jgi:hypothetical protein
MRNAACPLPVEGDGIHQSLGSPGTSSLAFLPDRLVEKKSGWGSPLGRWVCENHYRSGLMAAILIKVPFVAKRQPWAGGQDAFGIFHLFRHWITMR